MSQFDPLSGVVVGAVVAVAVAVAVIVVAAVVSRARTRAVRVDHDRLRDAQSGWTAPPELASASLPRGVKFTPAAMTVFGIAFVFAVAGAAISWYTVQRAADVQQRQALVTRDGVVTQGVIRQKWIEPGKNRVRNVGYTFRVNGAMYGATAHVTSAFYDSATPGAAVPVTYASSNPSVNRIAGELDRPGWFTLALAFPFLVFLIMPIAVWRQKQLLEDGTPACAVVERVSPMKGGYAVAYRFVQPNGDAIGGRSTASRRDKRSAGDAITIVYDPSQPKRNALYPLKYVRLSGDAG